MSQSQDPPVSGSFGLISCCGVAGWSAVGSLEGGEGFPCQENPGGDDARGETVASVQDQFVGNGNELASKGLIPRSPGPRP